MKQKSDLFSALDTAKTSVSAASNAVQKVHDERAAGSYNSTVTIHWTTKKRWISCWKATHYKTKHHYRNEVRFDQKRFNDDLANANKQLSEKQQQLMSAKRDIQKEINKTHSLINQHDSLQRSNQNLESSVKQQKTQLNAHCNLDSKAASMNSQKSSLQQQCSQNRSDISSLPGRITQNQTQLTSKQQEQTRLEAQREQAHQAKSVSQQALHDKLAALDNFDRAKLVFNAVSKGDDEFLSIVESYGYCKEFAAYVAVQKNSLQVLNYCIEQGIDFDSFISEDVTLAASILNMGDDNFINALFSSGQSLKLTALSALSRGDLEQLTVICKHEDQILSKIQEIDICGLSAIQLAIASGNLELIEFIKETEPACLSQEIRGYKNIFEMALVYNDSQIIEAISTCVTEEERVSTISYFFENNEIGMFERSLENVHFSQEQLCNFYQEAILKDCFGIASLLADSIEDIKSLFVNLVSSQDFVGAIELIASRENEITLEYINDLIGAADNSSEECIFLSDLYDSWEQNGQNNIEALGDQQDQVHMAM